MKYQGFTPNDIRISNGVHGGDAVDLSAVWGTDFCAPFEENNPTPRDWVFIKVNMVDKKYGNVRYSAVQDVLSKVCWGYFHTNIISYKVGQHIKSGVPFIKNAPNGIYTAAMLHLASRYPDFKTKVNPMNYLVVSGNMVKGFPKVTFKPMNIPAYATVKVIRNQQIGIYKTPSDKAEIVGALQPGQSVMIGQMSPQTVIADGYEWSPVESGWIAVQVVKTGTKWVEVTQLPPTCEEQLELAQKKIEELEKQIELLKAEQEKLRSAMQEAVDILTVALQ